MVRAALILALSGLTGACSGALQTYAGPSRNASQVAVILPENAYNRSRDEPFGAAPSDAEVRVRVAGHALGGTHNRFEVLPGHHDLAVAYLDRTTPAGHGVLATRAVTLALDAQAGHTYAIRGTATWADGTPTVTLWAVDASSRRTVSSVVVPSDHVLVGPADDSIIPD
jgi:hypothetical protein